MNFYELTLYYTSIQCNDETTSTNWFGSDEINSLGVGVTEVGIVFPVPYKDLGDWDAGDRRDYTKGRENTVQFYEPARIVKILVPGNSLHVSVGLFLTENDSSEPLKSREQDLVDYARQQIEVVRVEANLRLEGGSINGFNRSMETTINHQVKVWGGDDESVLGHATLIYKHPGYVDRHTIIVPTEDHTHEETNYFTLDNSEYKITTRWYLNPTPVKIDVPPVEGHSIHIPPPARQ